MGVFALFLTTTAPAIALIILSYRYRVDEDQDAVYTSQKLGTVLFVASIGSTFAHLLPGMSKFDLVLN